ncbi:hypothetical protein MMC10_003285 [Thelotrema lepadinum]|nr:hypothetical protein [Thelotrema lepadinum]
MQSKALIRLFALAINISLSLGAALSLISRQSTSTDSTPTGISSDIWDFPNGTWVENLAIRSNGQILTTLLTTPQVYQVDPDKKAPAALVHSFTGFRGCLGIVELKQDIFYVVVGNATYKTFPDTPGSWTVWRLDMTKFVTNKTQATATEVAAFPQSSIFNGITSISPSSSTLLIADSGAGIVWSLDTITGAKAKVAMDPLMAPTGTPGVGVNGIKVRQQTLYFTNSQQSLFGSAPISAIGKQRAAATALATGIATPDDFQFDSSSNAFLAGNDQVRFHAAAGGPVTTVSSAALLVGSTAVQFGRRWSDQNSLYVTTHGPLAQYASGNFTSPGRVVRLDLSWEKGSN